MAARWVAAAILPVMVAIIGIFLWAIIRPPAPPVEGAAGTPVALEKRIAGPVPWTLAAQAVPRADRMIAVTVSAKDIEGRPLASPTPPTAVLRMLDMAMEDERVALVQEGAGLLARHGPGLDGRALEPQGGIQRREPEPIVPGRVSLEQHGSEGTLRSGARARCPDRALRSARRVDDGRADM